MASVTSQGWKTVVEDAPEIDGDLLMALLEDSQVQQEDEDERLGCVIRSLEAEIGHNAVGGSNGLAEPECEDNGHWMDYGLGTDGLDGTCHTDGPFDWIDMDMDTNSHLDEMGNWNVETCGNEVDPTVGFLDGTGEYSPFCSGDYSSIEHGYSFGPLWHETYDDSRMI